MGDDESTFLCAYQSTRRYGSTSNLEKCTKQYKRLVRHEVKPNDTLQGIVLEYNSSMGEVRRLNRLWNNECLHMKSYLLVPLYEDADSNCANTSNQHSMDNCDGRLNTRITGNDESLSDIFSRIDLNIKETSRIVNRLQENYSELSYPGRGVRIPPNSALNDRSSINSVTRSDQQICEYYH